MRTDIIYIFDYIFNCLYLDNKKAELTK